MTITAGGFAGSLDETQWAQLASLIGTEYSINGTNDCRVTARTGVREVAVANGRAYGHGVLAEVDSQAPIALPAPAAGQWHLIVIRRNWTAHTVTIVAVPGGTSTNATPASAPASYPALNSTPGVLADQPLAWAWVNSTSTTVTVFDVRASRIDLRPAPVHDLNGDQHTGILSVASGGTGAATATQARTALGITPANIGAQPAGNYAASTHTHDDRYFTESEVTTKLSTKAASSHTHPASQITGTLPVANGGTGETTEQGALRGLGIRTSTVQYTGTVPISGDLSSMRVNFPSGFPDGTTVNVVISQFEDGSGSAHRDLEVYATSVDTLGFTACWRAAPGASIPRAQPRATYVAVRSN